MMKVAPIRAHPEHIHRRTQIDHLQPGQLAHSGAAPVGPHDQVGPHLQSTLGRPRHDADDPAAFLDQATDFGLHPQREGGTRHAVLGQEVQEVPLGHERDELADGGQMREIDDGESGVADLGVQMVGLLMGTL